MDFDLTPEQHKRSEEILVAVRRDLPGPLRETPDAHFDRAAWRVAARIGLTGLCLPPEHGGQGLGALDTALALEAFGQACTDTGLVFGVAAHLLACAVPVRDFGEGEVRARLLAGMASGDLIAGNAMTEDGAGSDVSKLATTALPAGDGYLLNGEKSFVSNGPLADVLVTYAVTDPAAGFLGISAFAVPTDLPGVEVCPPMDKMGLHGCPAGRVRFTDCRVPAGYLLGAAGQGGHVFQYSMGWERGCLFGLYLGVMREQLDRCIAHARQRRQFGQAIGANQAVSHRIAAMSQRLEAARLLLYRACWLVDQRRDHDAAVSMSKLAVSEAAIANGLDAVQIFGAAGYLRPTGIEQQLRDAVPAAIFSGTNDIHRVLVAREAGL